MPQANVLYIVTSVVVLGLAAWVGVVLVTAKERWSRDLPKPARATADVPVEPPSGHDATSDVAAPGSAEGSDASD